MLDISRKLINELNKENIRWLHWKGNNHYQDGLNGDGDVDIFTCKDDRSKIHTVLKNIGFINPNTQAFSQRDDIEDWIGFDSASGIMIHIHLHFNIVFGRNYVNEYTFIPYDICFDLRQDKDGFKIQNPSIEYLILLCRIFTGALKSADKINKNLAYLKSNIIKQDFIDAVQLCSLSPDECERLYEHLDKGITDTDGISDILKKLIKKNTAFAGAVYYKRKIQCVLYNRVFKNSAKHFTKKGIKGGGRLIAFVGQDGAGKSTVTNDIKKWLRWKLEAKTFYLGSGEHYKSPQRAVINRLPHKSVFKIVIALLVVSDHKRIAKRTLKALKNAKKYSENGGIAIFDRYPQNKFAGINDGPKIRSNYLNKTNSKTARFYMRRAAEKEEKYIDKAVKIAPDLLIKLMLPPEESLRRKPKENYENVSKKHEIIKSIDFGAKEVYTVDVTQNYDSEIIEIKNIIWNDLLR